MILKDFTIIVSASKSTFGIGNNGKIPWSIRGDMAFFKRITTLSSNNKKNAVIMGRKTWESLPNKFRPLPERVNIVISRNQITTVPATVIVINSLNSALELLSCDNEIDKIFVIGGESIYRDAINSSFCTKIYLTEILTDESVVDTFFPSIPSHFIQTDISNIIKENNIEYQFIQYDRIK